ncbi:MAG: RagB/SusD family nutrient uptake outer membrane protein [Bacteroidales bacterium]|nr:RagB/SusD family nutrient uptake outer membrane protein [Bacteroidales bacterium]
MKNIYRLLAVIAIVAGLTSCAKDFMETAPTDSYDADFVLSTVDNAEACLNGMHKAMVSQYFSRQNIGGIPSFQIAMDCLGEDLVFPVKGNGWWTNTGEYTWSSVRNADDWTTYFPFTISYRQIANANRILDKIDNIEGDATQKNYIKGECLAYRAYFYFWLVQLYADRYDAAKAASTPAVPLVLSSDSDKLMQPISNLDKVYEQICKDLEDAIPLLGTTTFTSKCDITAATAMGIRARVALVMKDWAKAKEYADKAIAAASTYGYKLMNETQYKDGFNDASNPEWMWGFQMIDDQTLYFYGFMAYMSWNFNSSNIRACPKCINSKLYDKIPDTDVRKGLFDPTGKAWTMPTKSYVKYPYMNRKFAVKSYTSSVADANFMRLGEMYLIAAEACAKNNKPADAQQYLYDLNKTRDAGYTKSTKTGDDLIEEIYTYRRIELWGEGHRFLDLKRNNLDLDRTGANHDPAVAQTMTLPASDIKWKIAYPTEEIEANDYIDNTINK